MRHSVTVSPRSDLRGPGLPYGGKVAIGKGDKVSWNTSQGMTHGRAVEKKTAPFSHAGQKFNASPEEPYWIVQSDKSGAQAAHKESSLKAG
jgi:hypothetical protein